MTLEPLVGTRLAEIMSTARTCRLGVAVALLACQPLLSGCASTIADNLPTAVGGLPEGAPQRTATPTAYPAVHDMPPTRSNAPLTAAEQKQLETELIAARNKTAPGSENDSTASTGSASTGSGH
jgi:hypothetical protein